MIKRKASVIGLRREQKRKAERRFFVKESEGHEENGGYVIVFPYPSFVLATTVLMAGGHIYLAVVPPTSSKCSPGVVVLTHAHGVLERCTHLLYGRN